MMSSRDVAYFVHTKYHKAISLTYLTMVCFAKHICESSNFLMFLPGMVIFLVLTEKFNSSILENLAMEVIASTVTKVVRVNDTM